MEGPFIKKEIRKTNSYLEWCGRNFHIRSIDGCKTKKFFYAAKLIYITASYAR